MTVKLKKDHEMILIEVSESKALTFQEDKNREWLLQDLF